MPDPTAPAGADDLRDRTPCPVDHQCEGEASCGCWCDLHDVPIAECPTFTLVRSWLDSRDAELERLRTEVERLADFGVASRELHRAEIERLRAELAEWCDLAKRALTEREKESERADDAGLRAEQAEADIARVRALHARRDAYEVDANGRHIGKPSPVCEGCSDPDLLAELERGELTDDLPDWPCPTLAALATPDTSARRR